LQDQRKGCKTVAVPGYTDKLAKGVILGYACGVLCASLQFIVSQWELIVSYPPILFVFILSVGFTGINILADGVVIFLIFMASIQTILFWIKQAWYMSLTYTVFYVLFVYALLTEFLFENSMLSANDPRNRDGQEDFTIGIYIYRSIRLLNDLHNITFGALFVPLLKLACLVVLFISTYATIKLRYVMHPVVFGFFLGYIFQVFLMTFPGATIMSKIFCLSSQFRIQQAKYLTLLPPVSRIHLQRQLASLPALKCQVGEFYHMEGKAKLTLADNMTHGVAFMLLSFN